MAETADSDLPDSCAIVQYDADLRGLLAELSSRQAGGSAKGGRYTKPDTARLRYIKTIALPGLRFGKMPPSADHQILYADPSDESVPGYAQFVKKHGRDPRSTGNTAGLDEAHQTTLLQWAQRNAVMYAATPTANRGAPSSYKLEARAYENYPVAFGQAWKGHTLSQMCRMSGTQVHSAAVHPGDYIRAKKKRGQKKSVS